MSDGEGCLEMSNDRQGGTDLANCEKVRAGAPHHIHPHISHKQRLVDRPLVSRQIVSGTFGDGKTLVSGQSFLGRILQELGLWQ
jgi:hypothetical protein